MASGRSSMARIQAGTTNTENRGATSLCARGDHLRTLPVLQAVAKPRPVRLVHLDVHSDSNEV